ncbi:two-component system, OmpR family, heavy metal sensor histidine kinase CusS [Roseateles sp. YR242]|uniref:heavy metal sensor histidine kinase n=1 Tax=Roseateles sp. YR242 TaxID=1855305 RepID=UPI0008AFE96F|nr:heavy metal sensor histidine kinase [Roseateles sp. YR242]SEL65336.1 two-component system, OmpR family, heavy metal sensor histidine kinase CusS [Roseateles sp. YR242]
MNTVESPSPSPRSAAPRRWWRRLHIPDGVGPRLSLWLATQTFTGLALVSLAVYLLTASDLRHKQGETLQQNQALLIHLLDEHRGTQAGQLHKRLDEFLEVHRGLTLTLQGPDGTTLYDRAAAAPPGSRRAMNFPMTDGLRATLLLDTRADDAFVRRLGMTLMAASLIGALLVSAGSMVLVRLALAPVRSLVDQTRRLAADTLHERLDGSDQPDELRPLVQQFNALLERLNRSYTQLKGFNADVAHELRTPLATLITATELAMRQPGVPAATLDQLGSNLEELRRMAGIVNDMLFLSHANSGAAARRQRVPSLAALARDVADYHEAAVAEAGLQLEINGDASGEVDAPLLKRALSNLLGNATRYASNGSTLQVCIDSAGGGLLRLWVANVGPPIPPEHLPRLFDRFYRADPSRTRGNDHHGLGLSIVAAIARMHGGAPFAMSAQGQTRVGLTVAGGDLPAAAGRRWRRRRFKSTHAHLRAPLH